MRGGLLNVGSQWTTRVFFCKSRQSIEPTVMKGLQDPNPVLIRLTRETGASSDCASRLHHLQLSALFIELEPKTATVFEPLRLLAGTR